MYTYVWNTCAYTPMYGIPAHTDVVPEYSRNAKYSRNAYNIVRIHALSESVHMQAGPSQRGSCVGLNPKP